MFPIGRFFALVSIAALVACDSGTVRLTPQPKSTNLPVGLPPTATATEISTVPAAGASIALPPNATVTGSIVFPATTAGTPATFTIAVSNVAPSGEPVLQARARRLAIGTVANPIVPLAYVSLTTATATSFVAQPGLTLALPAGTTTAGRTFAIARYDPSAPTAGWEAVSEGPVFATGTAPATTTFVGQSRATTFAAGVTYTFALYAQTAATATTLYVLDTSSNAATNATTTTVYAWPTTATGNVAPIRALAVVPPAAYPNASGAGLAEDASGDLYVTTPTNDATNAALVFVYAPGATGAATPIRTIGGANTMLTSAASDSFVDGNGNLWVNDAANVLEFAPGANGNVAPIAVIGGNTFGASGIAVQSDGTLYTAQNQSTATTSLPSFLEIFAPGSSGNATPQTTIGPSAASPFGGILTLDAAHALYTVTASGTAVSVYPQGATTPARTISGGATGLVGGQPLAIDPLTQDLFVANENGISNGAAPLLVFAPTANGNVAPIATLAGSNVPITRPLQIAIGL